MVGMSKNGSRYGRRSNWFKIHCLLQEQQQQREQQAQHQQPNHQQAHDLMFLNLMDDYSKNNHNRASLSSSSPSISSPDSHNSDSSVEIGEKKKNQLHKIPPKISAPSPLNPSAIPSQLASFFQLMPPLGPLPLHLVGSPFTKLMPPPPLASSAHSFLPPSLFASPFHDSLHHLYAAQQQSFLSSAAALPSSPLANLPNNNNNNNNNKDSINNNLLHINGNGAIPKGTDFYQKYYFNKLNGKFPSDREDTENEEVTPSNSPPLKVDVNSPASSSRSHSRSPASIASHSPPIICDDIQNNPIDLSMKNEDLLNNNTN
jgi:nuclear receptor subfamily 0 group A